MKSLRILLAAAALFATVAANAEEKSLDKLPLAHVNGDPITVREVLDVFNDRHSGHSKFLGGDAELRKFLAIVIDDRLLVQEAYEIGLDQDPLIAKLTSEYERKQSVTALVKEEIEVKARPAQADIEKVWKSLDFILQVRQITLPARQEAEEIRAAILQGGDIDTFARTCSIARTRLNGGHAMVMWGNFTPEWEAAVFPLEPGEVSPVIETPGGFDVIVVENRVETPLPKLEKVKDDIETTVYRRRLEERKKAYAAELSSRYHVELAPLTSDPRALAALLAKAPETIVAKWDGDGKLTLKDTFQTGELDQLFPLSADRARAEIDNRIRMTVNEPLVALDAAARKIAERPDIADDVATFREYNMEGLLYRDHIFKDLDVKDDEVAAYYEAKKQEFEAPPQWHVAQILVATEAEAKAIRGKLASADFAEIAQQSSKDFVTAAKGGDLGWISATNVPPDFAEILTLAAGAVSKPIHDTAGWHLIKVLEAKPAQMRALAEVRDQVKARVLDNKKRALREQWIEKLRAASKIEIDDAAILKFVKANEFSGQAPPQHGMQ